MPSSNFNVARSPPVVKRERDADENADHPQKKTAFGFGLKTSTVVSICVFCQTLACKIVEEKGFLYSV